MSNYVWGYDLVSSQGANPMKISLLAQIVLLSFFANASAPAQSPASKVALPMVASAAVPLYPPLAHAANMEGIVHVRVTTDGQRVKAAHAEDGPKPLAEAAEENARTWQFAVHEPTTFTVTYKYSLPTNWNSDSNNPVVVLHLPTEVQVSAIHFHTGY
jgi:outer membrane biosynthesis protein TonB